MSGSARRLMWRRMGACSTTSCRGCGMNGQRAPRGRAPLNVPRKTTPSELSSVSEAVKNWLAGESGSGRSPAISLAYAKARRMRRRVRTKVTRYGDLTVVYSAAFSSDGQRVVTARADHPAQVWDAASGKQLAEMDGHPVHTAVFSPDGQRVVTVSTDHAARVWEPPPESSWRRWTGTRSTTSTQIPAPSNDVEPTSVNPRLDTIVGLFAIGGAQAVPGGGPGITKFTWYSPT